MPEEPMPNGDAHAPGREADDSRAELFAAVYGKLREIAAHQLASERAGHTLQATALVHEAWLRLGGKTPGGSDLDRGSFLRSAAEAMRRILIDHARTRGRVKRGGGRSQVPIDPLDLAGRDETADILALDEAIAGLERVDPRMAEIAKLRVFAGLSADEAAVVLGVHARTVRRDWILTKAYLHRALNQEE